ncbi:MAG: PTS sugar transporter subunit IIA [Planctomycetota bacterium]|jgi:mannitol/fructose-specific phosphotransferase system IIA component (Ntr-type)
MNCGTFCIADRFDHLLTDCTIFDLEGQKTAQEVFEQAAAVFSKKLGIDQQVLLEKIGQREAEGSTVLETGLAIPHVVVEGDHKFEIPGQNRVLFGGDKR